MDNLPVGSTIYIAGPMRGHACYNFERFFYFASFLKQGGYKVINPAQIDCEKMLGGWVYTDEQYPNILLADLNLIKDVDALFMLKGWEKSPGAKAEHALASAIGKGIYYESDKK